MNRGVTRIAGPAWSAGLIVACAVPLLAMVLPFIQAMGFHRYVLEVDFRGFYTGGRMLLGGVRGGFYDLATQYAWQREFASQVTDLSQLMPFPYLPFVGLPLALVAGLPIEAAYLAWLGWNLALLVVICSLLAAALELAGRRTVLCALVMTMTFLPVMVTMMQGQPSFLLVLALLNGWAALRSGSELRGGLWLALLLVKPHLVLLPALALAWQRRIRALTGLVLGGGALLLVSLLLVGWDGLLGYGQLLLAATSWGNAYTIHPQAMHTWRGFLHLLLGTDEAADVQGWWLLGVVPALGLLFWVWRRRYEPGAPRFDLQWAMLVVVMLFVSPHANFHDVSLLVVPGAAVAHYPASQHQHGRLDKLLAALPFLGYVVAWTTLSIMVSLHLQLSVLFMLLAVITLAATAWQSERQAPVGVA